MNPSSDLLAFSSSSPIETSSEGLAVMAKPKTFSQSTWYENLPDTPPPTIFSGTKYVPVLVRRINHVCRCPEWSPTFGSIEDLVVYNSTFYNSDGTCFATSCFAMAEIKVTLGQTICRNCRVAQQGVVEAQSSSPKAAGIIVQPDPWVEVIFDMLPDVMALMTLMNTTDATEFQNLEGYVKGFVSQAYQASWNSITDLFAYSANAGDLYTIPTTTMIPRSVIQAQISWERMVAWFGVNLMLTVAGAMLVRLRCGCHHENSASFVSEAFQTIPTGILDSEGKSRDVTRLILAWNDSFDAWEAKRGCRGTPCQEDDQPGSAQELLTWDTMPRGQSAWLGAEAPHKNRR